MKTEELLNRRILVRSGTSALTEFYIFEFSTSKKHAKVGKIDGSIIWMDYDDSRGIFDNYYSFIEVLPETSKKPAERKEDYVGSQASLLGGQEIPPKVSKTARASNGKGNK